MHNIKIDIINTILRCKYAKVIIYNSKVKSIFKNIKKKKTKTIKKLCKIIYQKLKINKIT